MHNTAFFYGTLLRPDIIRRVVNNDAKHLTAAPAILLNHTRLRVQGRDYPAVVPSDAAQAQLFGNQLLTPEQRAVQGILVFGITKQDFAFLDAFEGEDEYTRELLPVHQIGSELALDDLQISPDVHSLPTGQETVVTAGVYIWCGSYKELEPQPWSFDNFVRQHASQWESGDGHVYTSRQASDFGHDMKKDFGMAPEWFNINHGSYGTVPLRVIEYAEKLGREANAKPDAWFKGGIEEKVLQVRQKLAELVNADLEECVMVVNATHGVNHALRNFAFNEGDVIVVNQTTYGAVQLTAQYFHDVRPQPEISVIDWTFPMTLDAIVEKFRAHLQAIPRKEGQRVIAIIDAISSAPGLLLPWERLCHVCKELNVWSLVDAAHAIGQVQIDLHKADPDFWVSNCHKWLYSRAGSALFYVPRRNHHIMKSSFPTSWAYRPLKDVTDWTAHFNAQFSTNGGTDTIDFVPYLSIAEALRFRQDIGGEKAIISYCHFLALHGGRLAAEVLGTRVMDEDGSLTANMVNILLPLPVLPEQTPAQLTERVLQFKMRGISDNMAIQTLVHDNKWWWRASAQIWNELSDFKHGANWYKARCEEFQLADEKASAERTE
ncbi:PLP-dependent transferase [Auriculariales sp. MPI-PUGE-AT-0066]|nr:PLP-dependent transferase [Auriculariales sp. MPI-PUGE-AT-0066]